MKQEDSELKPTAHTAKEIFQRSLTAHLPPWHFAKLQQATVLVAGVGGGSNIAELLARKGIGNLIIADLDRFEPHNVRQRCSLMSTMGKEKVLATRDRLLDVNPNIHVRAIREGITLSNVEDLVRRSDFVIDMIDLHSVQEKIALYRASRASGKFVLTAPSVINGAVLWIFPPDGISYEEFCGFKDGMPLNELAWNILQRFIAKFPEEAPEALYRAAANGERTIPLDAVGVDQAAVMMVSAIENLILGRMERVVLVPAGLHVDTSDPRFLAKTIDFSKEFAIRQ